MSGILALLDDVAAIAKLAASSLDDIAAQTIKAGSKSAGVVIDDAAVTPKYVTGLPAAREIPIVAKIARSRPRRWTPRIWNSSALRGRLRRILSSRPKS